MSPVYRPEKLPRICFVGPMLGQNKGWVVTQGEILAELFARDGYTVRLTSGIPFRLLRLGDIVRSLILWRGEIDVVNLAVFSGSAFFVVDIASLVVKWLRKPAIFVLRGGNLPQFAQRHPMWVHRVLERANVLVSPSDFLAHFFQKQGLEVSVIPNVLQIEAYPFRLRQKVGPRLFWMRTFHQAYNPEMAVEVLKELRSVCADASLTMAGQEKGQLEPVRRLVERYGLTEAVHFAGFLDLPGKQKEFSAHDIFINTNRVDNMPVSVLEAAAFGLPVVATNVGGIPFLLEHEKTVLLVRDGDAVGMTQAVERLIQEPALAARLSRCGRLLAESCSWHSVKKQWECVINGLVDCS